MRAVAEMDGDGRSRIEQNRFMIAIAAVSPYVQFLYNATRILRRASGPLLPTSTRRTSSSNGEHPANGATAEEAATKRKFQLKILLMSAFSLFALAFAVPFGVMSTNDGRMTQLSAELTLIIALGIVFLCLVIIPLLFFWDTHCLRAATFICIMGNSLFLGLAVLATLAALHLI